MKKALKILLISIVLFFVVTFAAYITNADSKMVEFIYDWLLKYHDSKHVEERI